MGLERVPTLIGAALLHAAAAPPVLAPSSAARLDAAIDPATTDAALPSALVDLDQPGRAPHRFLRGKADLATGAARQADQPVRIASFTRTATAILPLAPR